MNTKMMRKLIGKFDRVVFFGLIKFLYIKIKDYLNLKSLKDYNYQHTNYYNYKKTLFATTYEFFSKKK